jgi:serine/threonine-protein kinase
VPASFDSAQPRTASGASMPAPGSKLGRYEIVDQIAAGGMANVMLARATGPGGFDKLVALKLIHARHASEPSFVEMFLDEARIASRIQHPNVCGVFDFGSVGKTYYLAMDYLEGVPVSGLLKRLADDESVVMNAALVARMCRIVAEASEGLHAAHELRDDRGALLGVVHRDVSPHNLFVTFDGGVRVVDFGIAQATGKLHRTLTGVVKGKVAYMAPEQLRDAGVDRRSDVWALGVTLWELLTLERLFRRESEALTIQAVLSATIPPPSSIRPAIPPELDAIVLAALARDPSERTASARELGRALGQLVASTGQLVGMAEMAEWMESLFPVERAAKRELVERARTSGVGALAETLRRSNGDEVTSSGTRPARGTGAASTSPTQTGTMPTQPARGATKATASTSASDALRLPVARGPLLIALGIALAILVGVAAMWLSPESEPSIAPPPVNVPVPVPEPPLPRGEDPAHVVMPATSEPGAVVPGATAPVGPAPSPAAPASGQSPSAPRAPASPSSGRSPGEATRTAPGLGAAVGPRTTAAPEAASAASPGSVPAGPRAARAPREPARPSPEPAGVARSERTPAEPREAATPPPAAPPVADAPPGTLDVATPGGWADVFVAGRRVGRSPCRVSLPSGHHVVELRPFGTGSPVRAPVDVPPGGSTRLVRALEAP